MRHTLGIDNTKLRRYQLKTFLQAAGHRINRTAVGRQSVVFKACIAYRKLICLNSLFKLRKSHIILNKTRIVELCFLCNAGRKNSNGIVVVAVFLDIHRTAENRAVDRRKIRNKLVLVFKNIIRKSGTGLRNDLLNLLFRNSLQMHICTDIRTEGNIIYLSRTCRTKRRKNLLPVVSESNSHSGGNKESYLLSLFEVIEHTIGIIIVISCLMYADLYTFAAVDTIFIIYRNNSLSVNFLRHICVTDGTGSYTGITTYT